MKCFYHEDRDAVASCQRCGKFLCKQCASKYTPCLCDECAMAIDEDEKRRQESEHILQKKEKSDALIDTTSEFVIAIIKGIAFAVIFTFIFTATGGGQKTPLTLSVMFFFVPFGWAFITYLQQWMPVFFLSGILFIFYLMFKLVFSMILGIPCFFYQVIKFIVKLIKNRT